MYQPAYGNVPGHIVASRRQAGNEPRGEQFKYILLMFVIETERNMKKVAVLHQNGSHPPDPFLFTFLNTSKN
jgi:hypothetical protein